MLSTYYLERVEILIKDIDRILLLWDHNKIDKLNNDETTIRQTVEKFRLLSVDPEIIYVCEKIHDKQKFLHGYEQEIRQTLLGYLEYKSQNRYGNNLLFQLRQIDKAKDKINFYWDRLSNLSEDDRQFHADNISFLLSQGKFLTDIYWVLGQHMQTTVPEIYDIYEKETIKPSMDIWLKDDNYPEKLKIEHRQRYKHWYENEEKLEAIQAPYSWKGDKTDLAELIWALAKSGRVIDANTGQLTTQKELIRQFELLFGQSIDVTGLMKGRMNTTKAICDGKTFTASLQELVNERAASS